MFSLRMPQSAVWPAMTAMAFASFGAVLISSTQLYLIEQYVCHEYYTVSTSPAVPRTYMIDESICKEPEIQATVASIHGMGIFLMFTPSLFLAGPWGRISRLIGKKTVVLLSGCSITWQAIYYMIICYFPQYFNIRWIWAGPLFDIIGGGNMILASLIYTYIAESYDAKDLCHALYRFTALSLICGFLGMTVSSILLRVNVWHVTTLGIVSTSLMIPFILLLPSHTPYTPLPSDPSVDDHEQTELISDPEPGELKRSSTGHIWSTLITHHTHTLALFRSLLASSALSRTTLITFFLLILTSGIRVIFTQWASVHYKWSIASVHVISSFELIVSGTILLTLPPLSRRFLLPRLQSTSRVDITVAFISLAFATLGLALMALSPSRLFYILAISIFTLGAGIMDSLRSFSTSLIGDKEQVEKLYIGMGLVTTLGGMAASAGWNFLFSQTIGGGWWAERSPFWAVLVLIFALAFMISRLGRFAGKECEGEGVVV